MLTYFKNKHRLRRAAAIALAALLGVTALGCSRRRANDADTANATPAPTAAPEVTAEPAQGGTLRLAMPENAPSSDPLEVTTEEMLNLFSLVYDTLLTVSLSGELEPCLCESWTSESPGVWVLHLRDGVKWHDGTAFMAQEAVSTYEALLEMEDSYYKPCLRHILGMEAVDTRTLRVRLDTVGLMGLYSLTFPIKKIKPLIGTGAYRLERMSDEQIVLTVNENWWDKRPYIDKVIF
mgnify:CR=1 FL=1